MQKFCLTLCLLLGLLWPTAVSPLVATAAVFNDRYSIAGIDDAAGFEAVFFDLQTAVVNDDRDKVATFILYPLRVNSGPGQFEKINDSNALLANYDAIITPAVKAAFAKQQVDQLFVNYQGVMVGRGEAWLGVRKLPDSPCRYGIISINAK